jgi:hypothetical protein
MSCDVDTCSNMWSDLQCSTEGGEDLFLARSPTGAAELAAVLVKDQRGRGAQDADPSNQVEVLLGVDLHVLDTGDYLSDVSQDPPRGPAGSAERGGELEQGGALTEHVVDVGVREDALDPCAAEPAVANRAVDTKPGREHQHGNENPDTFAHTGTNQEAACGIPDGSW